MPGSPPHSPLSISVASQIRLAHNYLRDSRALAEIGIGIAATMLFQALEAALTAVRTSEVIDSQHWSTQQQLEVMADGLSDENAIKAAFKDLEHLTEYSRAYRHNLPNGRIGPPPSAADLASWTEAAAKLVAACVEEFGVKLGDGNSAASERQPLRQFTPGKSPEG